MTAPNVAPGSVIAGRFSVRSLLGYGGTTATFRAVMAPSRDVALKLYSPLIGQRPEAMQHLQRCVAETNALPPDLAAHILEAGYDPATAAPFTITDFVQSPSLAQIVQRRPMSAEEVTAMLRTLAAVLDAAHARGLFHHGLKPTNVFVDPAAPGNVKVTDFGPALARAMLPTQEGYVLAAPWIAPEQAQGGVQPRAAADIFSMALLAFAALTGRSYWRSCQGAVDVPSWQRELMAPRTPASTRAAELGIPLSPALDGIFARALSHDPNDRFRSATELAAALSGFATARMDPGTTVALAPSTGEAVAQPPPGLTGTVAVPGLALPRPGERAPLPVETQIAPAPAYFSQGGPAGSPAPSAPAAPSPAVSPAASSPAASASPAPGGSPPADSPSALPPAPAVSAPSAPAPEASSPAKVSPAAPTVASGGAVPSRSPLGKAASVAVGVAAVLLVGGAAAAWFALSGEDEAPSPSAVPSDVGSATASAQAAPPPEPPASALAPASASAPVAAEPPPTPDAGTPDDAGVEADAAIESTDAPVKITCKPVACEDVTVDGKPVDLETELRLPPGPHRITVKRAGYSTQVRTIIVKAGTPVEQEFELVAMPPPKPASTAGKPCGKFLKRCK